MNPLDLQHIPSISPVGDLGKSLPKGAGTTEEGATFSDLLKQAMQEVEGAGQVAQQAARNLMTGEATDMHSAILAVQKADVSFQMMMAVRSKLIDAYREVMRMQM
ncbi:MAG: flagellar hook-basal body complex protein FliE [Firmicutes bacterium]|nr:flagellar hook-basal body complex protein FliE [Bacillota bacterium]